jgi:serine/threonine protein kinase
MEEGQDILDNRYKIVKNLGGGAFGELYKVEKKKTGDYLAAKVEKAVKN